MSVMGTFRFHNVGQGLFYSGILNKKQGKKHDVFSFVYDCGTLSIQDALKKEIKNYKDLLPLGPKEWSKRLDLLVISHLHDDHVNGLKNLLNKAKVNTVVMPYVDVNLKKIAQFESRSNDQDLRDFYAAPDEWFSEHGGVRRILFLGDGKNEDGHLPSEDERGREEEEDIQITNPQDITKIDSGDENGKPQRVYFEGRVIKVECKKFHWGFQFENLPLDEEKINLYLNNVEAYAKKYSKMPFEDLFKNKEDMLALRRKADNKNEIFTGEDSINRTSVIMLHRPTQRGLGSLGNISCFSAKTDGMTCSSLNNYCLMNILDYDTTVLTGDIELKIDNSKEGIESLEIINGLRRCLVLQYPHHGGENDGLEKFKDLRANINVVSYGITNKYGHPSDEVLMRIPYLVHVTERNAFDYMITVPSDEDSTNDN